MGTKIKKSIPYILSLIAFVAFIVYVYKNADQYRELLQFSMGSLVLQVGLMILFTICHGLNNHLFFRGLNVPLSYNEGIGLAAINMLANQLPFTGGVIAKGVYLKQRYQLSYTRFFSATLALYNCFVVANGFVGLSILLYWRFVDQIVFTPWLFIVFAGMTATLFMFWVPFDYPFLPAKIRKHLLSLAEGWQVLAKNGVLVGQLMGVQILLLVIFAWRFWIAFHMLSQEVRLSQCLLFAAATIVISLVNITPGGLGIREVIVGGVASLLGFDTAVSVIAVGIDRLISTLVIIVMGAVYSFILSSNLTAAKSIVNDETHP